MRFTLKTISWMAGGLFALALCGAWTSARAQTSQNAATPAARPGSSAPRPEDLEPGVNTSAPAPSGPNGRAPPGVSAQTAAAPAPPAAPALDRKAHSTGNAPRAKRPESAATGSVSGSAPAGDATSVTNATDNAGKNAAQTNGTAPGPRSAAGPGKAHDRLELDTTQITGNRELPKVLYIVPWKRSDLGDLVGKPVNSLLDEVLTPVDRDVFKRQNRYYDALKPDSTAPGAGAASPDDKH
jgi:hypothetical protein